MKKLLILCMYIAYSSTLWSEKKIIGLVQVKNEQYSVEQSLHALSLYTDAIVVLDDASEDNTPIILQKNKQQYNLHILTKEGPWARDEARDKNLLLSHGRALGGTHFILIDADEMLTAQCAQDNCLRKKILALKPGNWLSCPLFELQHSIHEYQADIYLKPFCFCDEPTAQYDEKKRLHVPRVPKLSGKEHILYPMPLYGILHFKYINWDNVRLRNKWTQCLTAILWPQISRKKIGNSYRLRLITQDGKTQKSNLSWFDYSFFNVDDFARPDHWRANQISQWFKAYGQEYFKDLTIWDLN